MRAHSILVFAAAALLAVSRAQEDSEPAPDNSAAEKYDKSCFQCVNEGFGFCSADGINGSCIDISCEEDELTGDERKAAKGKCTLRDYKCPANTTLMKALSDCKPSFTRDTEKCPEEIRITKE